jgi:DNA invertase Pin-like site-specific DNA recombinase
MKKAAAYIRVSTDDQTEYSPASQQKAILEYAAGHNYVIPDEYIFTDEGISGRSTNRPSFQKMIGMAKSEMHPFDAIIVWKFSRFARNREDSIVYKSMLRRQYGIDVISVSEQLGVDKTSILIEALLEAMDEYYSINLAEEVVRGMSEKARRGGAMGAAAYGYIIKNGILIPDPEHAPIIREIFEKYAATGSIHLIAEWLNASGIPTRSGKKWTSRSVEYILRNVTYTGTMHWTPGGTKMQSYSDKITEKTIFSESPHEAIIPADLFEAVQKKIENTKRKYSRHSHRTHGRMFALKGLVRCSSCGSIMCMSAANHGLQCRRYACGECGVSHFIKLDTITQMVINRINYDFPSDKFKVAVPEAHFKKNTYEITASVPALLRSDIPEELKNEILHSFIGKIIFDRKNTAITIFYFG